MSKDLTHTPPPLFTQLNPIAHERAIQNFISKAMSFQAEHFFLSYYFVILTYKEVVVL